MGFHNFEGHCGVGHSAVWKGGKFALDFLEFFVVKDWPGRLLRVILGRLQGEDW